MENSDVNVIIENEEGARESDDLSSTHSRCTSQDLFQNDQKYLRSLLPEEVWRKLLSFLEDPNDLLNCANTSLYFRYLQQDERVVFLFPKVMGVLAVRYEPRECEVKKGKEKNENAGVVDEKGDKSKTDLGGNNDENQVATVEANKDGSAENEELDDDGNDDTEDEDLDYLGIDEGEDEDALRKETAHAEWRRTVFNCRLVCSTWNQAIENIYQTPLMTGIREYVMDLDPRSLENTMYIEDSKWKVSIWDLESAQRFLEHFEQSHYSGDTAPPKNPLFGRYISFNINEHWQGPENFQAYEETLTKILTLFGRHIWYCTMTLGAFSTNMEDKYLKLREWLSFMPNLRFIRLIGPGVYYDHMPVEIFQRNPLPNLEKLDNVILWGTAGPIVTELLRRNGDHLSFLKMRDIKDVDVDSVGGLLSNLKGFSSEYCTSGDDILAKYALGWKQLMKLDLFKNQVFQPTFDFLQSSSFPSEILTNLRLQDEFGHHTLLEESKTLRLDLPNLRRLHLWISRSFSLDFALPLAKSLEHLEISCFRTRDVEEQTIQFAGFENRMEESNIWTLFGKLKTVKMGNSENGGGFTVYTRKGNKFVYKP